MERLLRLRAGEARPVAQFATALLLFRAGIGFSTAAATALFLERLGSESIPWAFVGLAVVMVGLNRSLDPLVERLGTGKSTALAGALATVLAVLAGGLVHLLPATEDAGMLPGVVAFGVFLTSETLWVVITAICWDWFAERFDLLAQKRSFHWLQAAGAVGALLAGIAMATGGAFIDGVGWFYGAWALLSLGGTAMTAWALRSQAEPPPAFAEEDDEEDGAPEQADPGSRIFMGLLLGGLIWGVLLNGLLELRVYQIVEAGREQAELAAMMGTLNAAAAVVELGLVMGLFPWLLRRFGVRNLALVYPCVMLGSWSLLLWSGVQLGGGELPLLAAATVGWLALQGIQPAIDDTTWNLLYSAIPARWQSRFRRQSDLLVAPLAGAAAGAVLLRLEGWSGLELGILGLLGSALFVALLLAIRLAYAHVVLQGLQGSWEDIHDVPVKPLDPVSLEALVAQAQDAEGEELAWLLQAVWDEDPITATDATLAALARTPAAEQPPLRAQLERLLVAQNPEVLRRLLAWLVEGVDHLDASLISVLGTHGLLPGEVLLALQHDPDPSRRRVARWLSEGGPGPAVHSAGEPTVAELLASLVSSNAVELRRLQAALGALEDRAVPGCTTGLMDESLRLEGRLLCASVLARHAPAELEQRLVPVVRRALLDAIRFRLLPGCLGGSDDPGAEVLRRVYQEGSWRLVDFAVRCIARARALPEPARLSLALERGRPDERALALEALEQGSPRELFALLLPLADGRGQDDIRRLATTELGLALPECEELISEALESRLPLERAAGLEATAHRLLPGEDGALRERLLGVLQEQKGDVLRLTALSLVARLDGIPERVSPVKMLADLGRVRSLRELGPHTALPLCRGLVRRTLGEGETMAQAGDAQEALLFVQDGGLAEEGSERVHGPGSSLGEEGIWRAATWSEDLVATEPTVVVSLPLAHLHDCARRDRRMATLLLLTEGADAVDGAA